jgi:2-oxoglutarate dehydrogenase E1 component
MHEGFVNGLGGSYVQSLYEAWQSSPNSVDPSWGPIFQHLAKVNPDRALVETFTRPVQDKYNPGTGQLNAEVTEKDLLDTFKITWMIRAYEVRGHLIADLDPLGMFSADLDFAVPQELEPSFFGFTEADMDRKFQLGVLPKLGGLHSHTQRITLRELIQQLRSTYCKKVGWEYMHIVDGAKSTWLRNRISNQEPLTTQEKKDALKDLARAEGFENFLHTKYSTTKRFGLDGGETLIAMLNKIIDHAANDGVENFVIGMAHRGRLNVLAHICGKDMAKIFCEFEGKSTTPEEEMVCGDVKYHLGVALNRITRSQKKVRIGLMANPSHLESVNPVVTGKVRAKQHYMKDTERRKVMAILIHGDAAFSGQGVCYETMGLGDLEFYDIGGTVHIIANNQIGFTTPPRQSRSAPYCSELAKPVQAPVFHVNADDPESALRVSKIAVDFRNTYKKDVVIDLVCYRRFGHNETDEPSFTQPLMYQKIRSHPTTYQLYSQKLVADGVLTQEEVDEVSSSVKTLLKEKFELAKQSSSSIKDWEDNEWTGYKTPLQIASLKSTSVKAEFLQDIGKKITTLPDTFEPHPTLRRIIRERQTNYESGENIDWGSAEALAFGSLLLEGNHVRVSGQDVERGTFSQRHALLVDMGKANVYIPLANLHSSQAGFRIINSSLSEFGVCGYELGYCMENPASLVIWEAQFGDFANGAQVIFDQYLCSGEQKWLKQCGLVVNLPHGYDGMGPEHSSGRIERFLQQCDDPEEAPTSFVEGNLKDLDTANEAHIKARNWQVCYPSTPANYFHLLRRQIHRDFRKPLINFYSKAFLRAPNVSSLADMSGNTLFLPVIDDATIQDPSPVTEVLLCSGQVYFHLLKRRGEKRQDLAIVRIEQVAPFPWNHVHQVLSKYPKTAKVSWVQEEPKNMGSWSFVRPRLLNYLRPQGRTLRYVGRATSASTATGNKAMHDAEIKAYLDDAIGAAQ